MNARWMAIWMTGLVVWVPGLVAGIPDPTPGDESLGEKVGDALSPEQDTPGGGGGCRKTIYEDAGGKNGKYTSSYASAEMAVWKCPWYQPGDKNAKTAMVSAMGTTFPGHLEATSDMWSGTRRCDFNAQNGCVLKGYDMEMWDACGDVWVNARVYYHVRAFGFTYVYEDSAAAQYRYISRTTNC